jgi:D-amino-acid dehydrogenase
LPLKNQVVVVGGGAVGVTCAYQLAKAGAEVTLLERGPGLGLECSAGSAGLLCPTRAETIASKESIRDGLSWMTQAAGPVHIKPRLAIAPWLARLMWAARKGAEERRRKLYELSCRSLELHAELTNSGIATTFERKGILYVYDNEQDLEHGWGAIHPDAIDQLGCRKVDAKEAVKLEPALTDDIAGAVYCEWEGHVDSLGFVEAMGDAARQANVDVRLGVEVLAFGGSGTRRVEFLETTAGRLPVGDVVLAAGMWSRNLAAQLGLFVPLEGGKGYHADIPDSSGAGPRVPVYLNTPRVAATPLDGRLRLTGSLDLSGPDDAVNGTRIRVLTAAARKYFKSVDASCHTTWRGFRPMTPDGLPIIGRSARYDNLVIASGHGMKGVALSPVTGVLVTEILEGVEPSFDLALFSPARFRSVAAARTASAF